MKEFGNLGLTTHFADVIAVARAGEIVFDGEIWHPTITFDQLSSRLRSKNGDLTGVQYHIFDAITIEQWNGACEPQSSYSFADRYQFLKKNLSPTGLSFGPNTRLVSQTMVIGAESAENMYRAHLAAGCEGMMLRSLSGLYKHGRCTHNESNLFKFKHFETTDARIIRVVQRRKMRDGVERTYDPVGHLEKINTIDSYELVEAVGAFTVILKDGRETDLSLGRGFTDSDRTSLWEQRHTLIGRHIEFKWMPHGTKNLPRIGNVVRFRPDLD